MTMLFIFLGLGLEDFGLGGALGGGVGGRIAEAQKEGLDIHAFLAAELEVRNGDGAVLGGNGKVGFAVAEDSAGGGVKVCANLAEEDL